MPLNTVYWKLLSQVRISRYTCARPGCPWWPAQYENQAPDNTAQFEHRQPEMLQIMTLWKYMGLSKLCKKYLFMLINERHFHVLAGRCHQLAALWCSSRCLLLVSAHADQEEKAGYHQRDGYAGNKDVEDSHFAVVTWACQVQKCSLLTISIF